MGGSHVLERYLNQIAEEVNDPRSDISLKQRALANRLVNGNAKAQAEAKERADLRISPLGSGSDYTPFSATPWNRVGQSFLWWRSF